MFNKFANSWKLVKASAKVLAVDKELVIFPIISVIGVILVTAAFFLPVLIAGLGELNFPRKNRQ